MTVHVIIKRRSIEYEGSSEEIRRIYSNLEKAIKEKNDLQKKYGKVGFEEIEYYIDSYNVIE